MNRVSVLVLALLIYLLVTAYGYHDAWLDYRRRRREPSEEEPAESLRITPSRVLLSLLAMLLAAALIAAGVVLVVDGTEAIEKDGAAGIAPAAVHAFPGVLAVLAGIYAVFLTRQSLLPESRRRRPRRKHTHPPAG